MRVDSNCHGAVHQFKELTNALTHSHFWQNISRAFRPNFLLRLMQAKFLIISVPKKSTNKETFALKKFNSRQIYIVTRKMSPGDAQSCMMVIGSNEMRKKWRTERSSMTNDAERLLDLVTRAPPWDQKKKKGNWPGFCNRWIFFFLTGFETTKTTGPLIATDWTSPASSRFTISWHADLWLASLVWDFHCFHLGWLTPTGGTYRPLLDF